MFYFILKKAVNTPTKIIVNYCGVIALSKVGVVVIIAGITLHGNFFQEFKIRIDSGFGISEF